MSNEKIKAFTDLKTWQSGHELVILAYKLAQKLPREEIYSLTDQIKRSVTSVTANIAEGFGRQTYKEKIQFYYLAKGSLTELINHVMIAKDVHYLPDTDAQALLDKADNVAKLLQGLINKSRSFLIRS